MVEKRVSRGVLEYEILDRYPRVSQFVLEVEINDQNPRVSQFVLEVEVPAIAPATPYIFADAQIAANPIIFQNITADAEILALTTVINQLSADAEIAQLIVQQKFFSADAEIEARKAFTADAYIQKIVPCPTVWYADLDGPYELWLLDHDGDLLTDPITQYEKLDFVRAVNGQWHHGYGRYELTVSPEVVDTSVFALDSILSVRRITSSGVEIVFEGLHRNRRSWHDESGAAHYMSVGPDYKHLMKRRIVLPWPDGRAFLSPTDNFTDIMRQLAITQAQAAAGVDRWFDKFKVEAFTNEGQTLSMHYRNTYLNEDLDALADLGADWDIIRENSDEFRFRVFFPFKGRDRRRGNACGNPELVFSIDHDNITNPQLDEDRMDEATVVYVAGDGIGTDRQITERHNINDRESDSEWNRSERFFEQTKETSPAALAAWGDAFLVEHGIQRLFGLRLKPEQEYAYGVEWNLGDKCTGVYEGSTFHMRIVEVQVTLDPEVGREVIPTMFVYPTLEDY